MSLYLLHLDCKFKWEIILRGCNLQGKRKNAGAHFAKEIEEMYRS